MIRYLIKNNFKLMFRNKWSLILLILGPILTIAILSSAFSSLMKSYEGVEEFEVGYRIEKNSIFSDYISEIVNTGGNAGVTFREYPEGKPKKIIENNNLAGFVAFNQKEYVVYQSADYEIEGKTLEYFLHKVMDEAGKKILLEDNLTEETPMTAIKTTNAEYRIQLPVEQLEYMPAIDSKDYYGIIYIVYFCWCGIVCATGVINNEKKYKIQQKFQVSNLSEFKMYLSKLIPIVLTVSVGMGITTVLSVLLFQIHWGNALLSAMIVFLLILAGTSFGLMIYYISDNLIITIITLFTTVWFMGFFGGSFETYMFAANSDITKNLSPIYHGNRALVELSCMGHSDYVGSCVVYMLGITVICTVVAVIAGSIRKRGRA